MSAGRGARSPVFLEVIAIKIAIAGPECSSKAWKFVAHQEHVAFPAPAAHLENPAVSQRIGLSNYA
jgi:hypothetical protein